MRLGRRQFLAVGAVALSGCGKTASQMRTEAMRLMGHPTAAELALPLEVPQSGEIDEVSHVLNRLTFGPRPDSYARVNRLGARAYLERQLQPETIDDSVCDRMVRHEFEALGNPESTLFPRQRGQGDAASLLFPAMADGGARVGDLYEYKDKELLRDLTRSSLLRAVMSERQLYEVMGQFWTDHFNIDPSKGECKWLTAAHDRDVIRAHALGNFRDMVRASAVHPAMLWYLDGRANRRRNPEDKPNENYARELMELHTLGVHGGYTQEDVMEVARCLTGWTCRDRKKLFKGRVEFRPRDHDDGRKQVLGVEIPAGGGASDLDRVLEIVTSHPSCAQYLGWKLCRRFIADEPPVRAVEAVAKAFARSKGDIRSTLRALFDTAEFWSAENRGSKFKRPFHYVVSALRLCNAETNASPALIEYLLRLGHAPFRYPTPDGYPEEASHWQSSLLWRWNFATALIEHRIKGTRVTVAEWRKALSDERAVLALFLGRQANPGELEAFRQSGENLAVAIAAPAFQRC